jgi:hypothetical protein
VLKRKNKSNIILMGRGSNERLKLWAEELEKLRKLKLCGNDLVSIRMIIVIGTSSQDFTSTRLPVKVDSRLRSIRT